MRTTHALAGSAVAALLLAVPAAAQTPTPTLDVITATGTVQQRIAKPKVQNQRTIQRAVKAAQDAALPRAIASARRQAERIAQLTGVTLGSVAAVTEQNYGYFSGPYCRVVRKPIVRRDADGKRRVVGRGPRRRVCNVPPYVYEAVSVTFRIVPAA
ncbi:MAG: SIMPL domain-containing protein [Thermoleophilia bacterium]